MSLLSMACRACYSLSAASGKGAVSSRAGDPAPFEFTEVVQGLRAFGIKFIHSIRPRSKTVECIGGLVQDLMEAEPGYCGRNERVDAPETLRK